MCEHYLDEDVLVKLLASDAQKISGRYLCGYNAQTLSDNLYAEKHFYDCIVVKGSFVSCSFRRCIFEHVIFRESDFAGTDFSDCTFINCTFSNVTSGYYMKDCIVRECTQISESEQAFERSVIEGFVV